MGGTQPSEGLSDVHFIRLTLKDKSGKVVSENNYWRGNDRLDFTALNTLPAAELKVSSKLLRKNGQAEIRAAIAHLKSAKGCGVCSICSGCSDLGWRAYSSCYYE